MTLKIVTATGVWIACKDAIPEESVVFLQMCKDGTYEECFGHYVAERDWWRDETETDDYSPIRPADVHYWLRLPPHPQENRNET